ncbi:MAG: DNA repair protein RadC [Kiritimatiellae bacterium]|nr:DNA repair protein RadC [Kiritimatiellia bacterium]
MEKRRSAPDRAEEPLFEPAAAPPRADPRAATPSLRAAFAGSRSLMPREKIAALGPASLTDAELLALLLRSGTKGKNVLAVAEDLLRAYGGSLELLSRAGYDELAKTLAVGPAKASELAAVFELARRVLASSGEDFPVLDTPEAVARYLRPFVLAESVESFYALPLDKRRRLCGVVGRARVSLGTADATVVTPRDVFREAIRVDARFLLVAHNHPSGDPTPSPADLRLTADLVDAGRVLRIPLLDHVVLGDIPSRLRPDGTPDTDGCLDAVPRFRSIRASGAVDFEAPV